MSVEQTDFTRVKKKWRDETHLLALVKPNPTQFILAITTTSTAGEISQRKRKSIQLLYFILQGVITSAEKH
jgi:hypothetical protein